MTARRAHPITDASATETWATARASGTTCKIGLDDNGFYITTNEYTLFGTVQFTGAQLYAMSKNALASGAQSVPFVHLENLTVPERGQTAFTLRAANVPGTRWSTSKHGTVFLVSGMVGVRVGEPVARIRRHHTVGAFEHRFARFGCSEPQASAPSGRDRARSDPTPGHSATGEPSARRVSRYAAVHRCVRPAARATRALRRSTASTGGCSGSWYADGLLWFSLGTGVDVEGQELAGILYGALEPKFKNGKLKFKVRMQEYLAVQGNNVIMPAVGVDANGRG